SGFILSRASCFRKGTYIRLASGALRRIEDIRTEDFIQSAMRSHRFTLREATVVRIDYGSPYGEVRPIHEPQVNITFNYDTEHEKVNLLVSPGHPLFVYGQGWASCNPIASLQMFELRCQQLQVGDICLSLVTREPVLAPMIPMPPMNPMTPMIPMTPMNQMTPMNPMTPMAPPHPQPAPMMPGAVVAPMQPMGCPMAPSSPPVASGYPGLPMPHPYQQHVYAHVANFVAAYTQHIIAENLNQ
ncbi:hypothetical protein KR018_010346, partial [Drosophila ironensis]